MATLGTGSGGLATNGLDIVDGEGVSGSSTAYSLTAVDTESPAGSAPPVGTGYARGAPADRRREVRRGSAYTPPRHNRN